MEPMNTTTQAAGATPAAFVLSPLKSSDVWMMVRILKKIDIAGAAKSLDADLLKAMSYQPPTMMQGDEVVPLPPEKWTKGQKAAYAKAQEAQEQVVWQVLGILMENIEDCKDDVNRMLANSVGTDLNTIDSMPATDYLDLIVQYVTREDFADFFTHAFGLLQGASASRSSIVTAVTSIR